MKSEFEKILEYFSMKPEERIGHLQEILENSVGFFERFKYIMEHGSLEEKKDIIEKIKFLQGKIQEETKKISSQTEMGDEDLKKFIENPQNFTEEQWHLIQNARKKIEEETSDIQKILGAPKEPSQHKKPKSKRKDWMQG